MTLRDLQHAALNDLIELAPQAVEQAEQAIEAEYEKQLDRAERRYRRVLRRVESRYGAFIDAGRRNFERQTSEVDGKFAARLAHIEAERQSARAKIMREATTAGQEVKAKLDQEIWLADSVVDAARTQAAQSRKKLDKDTAQRKATLDGLAIHAEEVVRAHRFKPPAVDVAVDESRVADKPGAAYKELTGAIQNNTQTMSRLFVPGLFKGASPGLIVFFLCLASVGGAGWYAYSHPNGPAFTVLGPSAFGGALLLCAGLGVLLRRVGAAKIAAAYRPIANDIATARFAAEQYHVATRRSIDQDERNAVVRRDAEVKVAHDKYDPKLNRVALRRKNLLQTIEEEFAKNRRDLEARRDLALRPFRSWPDVEQPGLEARLNRYRGFLKARRDNACDLAQRRYDAARAELRDRWDRGVERIAATLDAAAAFDDSLRRDMLDVDWTDWQPNFVFGGVVRFGALDVDFGRIAPRFRDDPRLKRERLVATRTPAMLAFPERGSLLLRYARDARDVANAALQTVMARLLTTIPPGRAHFTIIDPVGLGQAFAGFMHLADYDDAMIGGRIWTEGQQIEQQLTDLTNHMENVIQKYLRNEYETIDEYNQQAGELAEPYRFLVVANFPSNFSEESVRRLTSIVASGSRCGVYTLISHDVRMQLPKELSTRDLVGEGVYVVQSDDGEFVWRDEIYKHFPLTLDAPPPESTLTSLMHRIGAAAKESGKVEVPFTSVAPKPEERWTRSAQHGIETPFGRSGATRLQSLSLGKGVAQHVLIAGKTGSGKSSLLHAIVTSAVLWYSPDEVELYLVDFKKGVEFKTYATHALPHARAIAIESDREFGLSVLQRLDEEMNRRGELFRRAGVQDIAGYRETADAITMPRTLLVIDEFQVFFSEDDKLAQDAAMLLDRLVRQGRAFGMHVILGSQTLGGATGLARSTIGQMAVRIALQCSEADSQLILDDTNPAARLLTRPGQAIYNDAGGLAEGNSPFQTAWLPDRERDGLLNQVNAMADAIHFEREDPIIVFEGSAPGDLSKNLPLQRLLKSPPAVPIAEPKAWLGEAIEIKEPTNVVFRRQSGMNLLLVGQRDDAAMGIVAASITGLGAQMRGGSGAIYLLDGSPQEDSQPNGMKLALADLSIDKQDVAWRDVGGCMEGLAAEVRRRHASDAGNADGLAPIFLVIYGLQRYRMLRKREDEFGLSVSADASQSDPGRDFAEVLREGPPVGVHVIAWCDTPTAAERTLDRASMREFDHRVLFQMSATDSSNLIDSPIANRLGLYRAIYRSEEQGVLEKFRPYGVAEYSADRDRTAADGEQVGDE
ncbi:MAG: cell division protein FtsK [Phycisphaerales bacterium]|nr:cell division protein FtsK [Phycisphaerales bacterium]MCB9856468.1 cell division protein FtsK [Phycisphaerales bacterium]MCB9863949.1 cell division protein FtsK [Phycisphaerales bacterium]